MNKRHDDQMRLLLVDDEEGFRAAIARRLAKRGLDPVQAQSGEACLAILEKESMDVVVLDVKMPGMTGIDTLKAIKGAGSKTQVILLTGDAAVSDGIEGIKAGAFDYLTKPVEIDHLVNKIRQAFEVIRMDEENQEQLDYRAKLEKKMIDTERLVSLGTMSTGIAHEINNPLAIINKSAGFMKQVINSQEMSFFPQKAALLLGIEKIEKSVKRASKITHQLLGHVKQPDSQLSEVDLKTLLNETLDLLKKELEDKQVKIHWETGKENNVFHSDPYQIRQVLMNLLSNAVHAVKKNGTITLSVRETDNSVLFEVKDNGVGIPRENLGKIFDPFFTTKSFEEGTGLGLFVVHKLLSNLNGEIKVESTVGKGSAFIVKLPRYVERKKQ